MNNDSVFKRLAVEIGGFSSVSHAWYRCQQVFKGINLKGKTFLEVGADKGVFSAYAATHGAKHVVALEPECDGSQEGTKDCFQHFINELNLTNLIVENTTIQDFVIKANSFDLVKLRNPPALQVVMC